MPAAYPIQLRSILRASKSRSQPAAFSMSEPRRGFGYAQATGTDVPVFWDVEFRFTPAEAVVFQAWFRTTIRLGIDAFTMPLRTEFGDQVGHVCRFLPDSLLPAREAGPAWGYTATIMARAQVVPAGFDAASPLIVGLPGWDAWAGWLDETVTREWPALLGPGEIAALFGGATGTWLDVSELSGLFTNAAGSTAVSAYGQGVGRINDISGNGANGLQDTSGLRPLLERTTGGSGQDVFSLDFDGIDDALAITFPAALGGACTVARAVPGAGASILTGQTIGASYSAAQSFSALVIIDRPVTPSEYAALTAYLNERAGV